ncbi:hypothetical protein NliqN6_6519 [Naganishia liquefaciens]|uniref:Uncharacterized protein n=1 Tax=Naganishia liquefaciens TaxID=104408 RepID=A0A8H3YJF3_9TREE|nr:hypothetical protein NliqN6_6519 [Naganishia liquefaciens]
MGIITDQFFAQGDPSSLPVRTLLWTVAESIIEVFILCVVGYILASTGVLDKQTQRKVNVLNVSFATPALLGSKVAFSLTPEKLREMWVIPLGFVLITGVSALVAFLMGTAFRLSRSQRAFAMCASMFQNSNSLPIALIQSLVIEVPHLKWGKDDHKDAMLGRALTYLVLYSTLGMMLRWSWGVKLLSSADDEVPTVESIAETQPPLTHEPAPMDTHPAARETDPLFSSAQQMRQGAAEDVKRSGRVSVDEATAAWTTPHDETTSASPTGFVASPPALTTGAEFPFSQPQPHLHPHPHAATTVPTPASRRLSSMRRRSSASPRRSSTLTGRRPRAPSRTESGRDFLGLPEPLRTEPETLSDQEEEDEESSSDEEDEEWGLPFTRRRQFAVPSSTRMQAFLHRTRHKLVHAARAVNQFMTVPMWSACISIIVAMIPPLQATLVKTKPLTQAITSAGQCSIPLTLVVLGAFFYSPPPPASEPQPPSTFQKIKNAIGFGSHKETPRQASKPVAVATTAPSKSRPGENRAVFVAVTSRMIVTPLLFMPLLAALAKYDLFRAAEDPVFILAATLIVSSPPALTLAQITQAASGDAFERLISKTISWSYAVLTPPLTLLYIFIGLLFGRL